MPKNKKIAKLPAVWSVYILECEGGVFYTGISPDPQKRFLAHSSGKGARFTRMHKPLRVLVTQVVGSYSLALRREYQVKRLQKPGKLKFIADPASLPLPDLSARWRKRPPKRSRASARRSTAAARRSPRKTS
jgi:putative endonuclease